MASEDIKDQFLLVLLNAAKQGDRKSQQEFWKNVAIYRKSGKPIPTEGDNHITDCLRVLSKGEYPETMTKL